MQTEITKADPFRNPDVVLKKDAAGNVFEQPRSPDPAAAPQPGDQRQPGDQPPVGNASVENGHLKVGDFTLSPEDVAGLMERRALEQSRAALVPKTSAEYVLPEKFDLPTGVTEFRWATEDPAIGPLLGAAKNWAHEAGLTNDQFQSAMKIFAGAQINEQRLVNEAAAREVSKLGELGGVRVDAVKQFLRGHLGDEAARALTSTMVLASQVAAYEKLAHKFASGGSGSFSGAHREPEQPGKISQEAYDKLGYAARLEYASRFRQPGA
jgi:hypothetical protein